MYVNIWIIFPFGTRIFGLLAFSTIIIIFLEINRIPSSHLNKDTEALNTIFIMDNNKTEQKLWCIVFCDFFPSITDMNQYLPVNLVLQ